MSDENIIPEEETTTVQEFLDKVIADRTAETPKVEDERIDEVKVKAEELEDITFRLDDNRLKDAIITNQKIDVTPEEKSTYLRALLHDTDISLPISLCSGHFTVVLKSRSTFEQQIVYLAANKDLEEEIIPNDSVNYMLQTQKYAAAMMLVSINGKPSEFIADTNKAEGDTEYVRVQNAINILRERRKFIDKMPIPKWSLVLNALRIFEGKIAILSAEVVNENFWTPED